MTVPTSTNKSKISLKQRSDDGVWKPIIGVAGLTLRQIFQKLEGLPAVCEYRHGEKVWYFCGTENWKKTMKKRGTSVTFSEAIVLLDSANPGWLEEIPVSAQMEEYMRMLGQEQPSLESYQED